MSQPAPRPRSWFSKKSPVSKRKEDAIRRMMRMETLETRCVMAGSLESHVMVLFTPTATAADISAVTASVSATKVEKIALRTAPANYGQLVRFDLGGSFTMENGLAKLRADSRVKIAEVDAEVKPTLVSNDPQYLNGSLWGAYSSPAAGPGLPVNQYGSQADTVWAGGNVGSNSVVVGVIDTGIDISHPDLAANIWVNPGETANNGVDDDGNGYVDDINGWDFAGNDNKVFDGVTSGDGIDDHGTHVAGTIGGVGNNGVGVAGINWNVKIISGKFLAPSGSTTNAIRAVDYMTDLKKNRGINLVATNNSWGGGGFSQLLLDAMGRLADADVLFLAAAGNANNNNDGFPFYPSNYDTSSVSTSGFDAVISVAAIDANGNRASFSSYGATTVDLAAPGVTIRSTTPFNTYSDFDGTSMATPHVTGGAALYKAANPTATAAQIKDVLLGSAYQTPTASMNGMVVTNGRLNLTKLSAVPPPPATGISIADATIVEGDNGISYVNVTLTLAAVSTKLSKVNFATANGTALSGSDYVATSGTVTIPQGQRTGTAQIPIYGDTALEANETFFVNLSNPVNVSITDNQALVTINNDDFATKVLVDNVSRLEGNTGYSVFLFTVSLSQPSVSTVTIKVATSDGSANDGMDYIGISPLAPVTLTFAPGVTSRTVSINAIGERLFEPDETFYLDILSATNAQIKVKRGTGTILNDDANVPGQPPGGGLPGTGPGDSGGLNGLMAASYFSSLNKPIAGTTTTKKK